MSSTNQFLRLFLLSLSIFNVYAEIQAQASAADVRLLKHQHSGGTVKKVKSKEQAITELKHYGYIDCSPTPSSTSSKTCTEAEVQAGIKKYQKTFNLTESGQLDDKTLNKLNQARCGVVDSAKLFQKFHRYVRVEDAVDRNNNILTINSRRGNIRQKRSIPMDKLQISPETEAAYKHMNNHAFRRRKRAVLEEMEYDEKQHRRMKRSLKGRAHPSAPFHHTLVRWRYIAPYSRYMEIMHLRFSIRMAFRYWSEVCELTFFEDNTSDIKDVDIEIGFGEEDHFGCVDRFDSTGGVVAHTQMGGPIHFDDAENFALLNLLRSITHEIGHALGLFHIFQPISIMDPAVPFGLNNFELAKIDRQAIQALYGKCTGRFNTVVDWYQILSSSHTGPLKYNTYFFRENLYWLYDQSAERPRYGDPNVVSWGWPNLPNDVDGVIQVAVATNYGYNIFSAYFKGDEVFVYDGKYDRVKFGYPKKISQVFGRRPGSNIDIPSHIDSVYYEERTRRLHFFKDNWVYVYDPRVSNTNYFHSDSSSRYNHYTQYNIEFNNCCDKKVPFNSIYKMASPTSSPALTPPIDAAYYSNSRKKLIFIKGEDHWIDHCYDLSSYTIDSCIQYAGKWNSEWNDLCRV